MNGGTFLQDEDGAFEDHEENYDMNHHEIFDEICFKRKAVPGKHQLT